MEAIDLALVTLPAGAFSTGCVVRGNNTFSIWLERTEARVGLQ
jgi:hypothetical protein